MRAFEKHFQRCLCSGWLLPIRRKRHVHDHKFRQIWPWRNLLATSVQQKQRLFADPLELTVYHQKHICGEFCCAELGIKEICEGPLRKLTIYHWVSSSSKMVFISIALNNTQYQRLANQGWFVSSFMFFEDATFCATTKSPQEENVDWFKKFWRSNVKGTN